MTEPNLSAQEPHKQVNEKPFHSGDNKQGHAVSDTLLKLFTIENCKKRVIKLSLLN